MLLKCNEEFAFLKEISNFANIGIYKNTDAKYLFDISKTLDMLYLDIENAKSFVFLEFYTLASGKVFGKICDLLIKKAAEGVEVRIIYDEIGSLFRLPEEFDSIMREYGITALPHASLCGSYPGALNNRNHRKIAVIDGEIAYTGGINLADEYVYSKSELGEWKDSAVRLEGNAVCALTYIFLSDCSFLRGAEEDFSKYYKYRKRACSGHAIVFSDGPAPIYSEKSAKRLILSLLYRSENYFTATTPYLVCGSEIFSAVRAAVNRGVKVRIAIPGKPDKFLTGILTRHYASRLSETGAEIYLYSPGFLHSKQYLSDGKYLICGTVNLDYRSLSHNFENGILFADHPVVAQAESEMENILALCEKYEAKKLCLPLRILGSLLEILAPLF